VALKLVAGGGVGVGPVGGVGALLALGGALCAEAPGVAGTWLADGALLGVVGELQLATMTAIATPASARVHPNEPTLVRSMAGVYDATPDDLCREFPGDR
jgi:hypothetical protein